MTYHQEHLTTYKNQPNPWCIIRLNSNICKAEPSRTLKENPNGSESQLIVRLRHRSDAEAHLQILRANNPTAFYEILFDITHLFNTELHSKRVDSADGEMKRWGDGETGRRGDGGKEKVLL